MAYYVLQRHLISTFRCWNLVCWQSVLEFPQNPALGNLHPFSTSALDDHHPINRVILETGSSVTKARHDIRLVSTETYRPEICLSPHKARHSRLDRPSDKLAISVGVLRLSGGSASTTQTLGNQPYEAIILCRSPAVLIFIATSLFGYHKYLRKRNGVHTRVQTSTAGIRVR
jgi:hypothetical protein